MNNLIWTIAHTKENSPSVESLELLEAGRRIGSDGEFRVETVLPGHEIGTAYRELFDFGAKKVYVADHFDFRMFNLPALVKLFADLAGEKKPSVILLPSNVYSRELASALSARLGATLMPDCVEITVNAGNLEGKRPIFGGRILSTVAPDKDRLVIATIRPNRYNPRKIGEELQGEIEHVAFNGCTSPGAVIKAMKESLGKMDVSEARIVVAGGRGVKTAENFAMLEKLADLLGGAVGATRSVVDEGWRDHQDQIGQTGKTITPDLYIACGISGAVQHLLGMNQAKCIVAINKDMSAPIMNIADYAIHGDMFEILPIMIKELEKQTVSA